MKRTIGVLALQGAYASHIAVIEKLGETAREIRQSSQLALCDALIIPGGESTVMTKMLHAGSTLSADGKDFYAALRDFAKEKPVMGTCAGLILLGRPSNDARVQTLDLLPVSVERNAYGRQTESFIQNIALDESMPRASRGLFPAVFIRAPRIIAIEAGVTVLASSGKDAGPDPVMVRYRNLLGLSFHPELAPDDTRIHEYFLSMIG